MGIKRLKIKDDLNYRNGSASKACKDCNHYQSAAEFIGLFGAPGPRCFLIGLSENRGYKINPTAQCDRFDNSNLIKRLRGV